MAKRISFGDIDDDSFGVIVKRLHSQQWLSLRLVCKAFCNHTDHFLSNVHELRLPLWASSEDLAVAKRMRNLRTVHVPQGGITDLDLAILRQTAPHISDFSIQECVNISSAAVLGVVKTWTNLTSLDIRGVVTQERELSHVCKYAIRHCPNLRSVRCDFHKFNWLTMTDATQIDTPLEMKQALALAAKFPQLSTWRLCAEDNEMSDWKAFITECGRKMHKLDLSDISVSAEAIRIVFSVCTQLKSLSLSYFMSDDDTDKFARVFKGRTLDTLESLSISKETLSDKDLKWIARHCKRLRKFEVDECELSCEGLAYVLRECTSLETLRLLFNPEDDHFVLHRDGLRAMAANMTKLRKLKLRGMSEIDAMLKKLRRMPNLIYLEIDECEITNAALLHLWTDVMHRLQYLKLSSCGVSAASVEWMLRETPSLLSVDISGCKIADINYQRLGLTIWLPGDAIASASNDPSDSANDDDDEG
eukprot:TRINITY_DN12392_c0_g1_i1.p1 TRINITY_DN12392_c0_g1~~TRINITY_DN12392_c0_g1_i1.p1  ORF type:complete len:531 (+),score=114.60 TRINITY_DN12392_c0_g1_i1:169-1593(+)